MSLSGLGILNYKNEKVSGESFFINIFLPSIIDNNKPIFFDIGANIGDYSKTLINRFPSSQVYAFEPHPSNFLQLSNSLHSDALHCYNLALGRAKEELTLYDISSHQGTVYASLHEAVISEIHKKDTEKFIVPVETLDEFCIKNDIAHIDFIKIDTEGNEFSVLEGAENLLNNNNISCIQFEFNEMNIVSKTFFRDFRKILNGYNLYRLLPNSLLPLDDTPLLTEIYAYQNIIALQKNDKKKK